MHPAPYVAGPFAGFKGRRCGRLEAVLREAEVLETDAEQHLPVGVALLVLELLALQRGTDVEALVLVLDADAIGEDAGVLDVVAAADEPGPVVGELRTEPARDLLAVAELRGGIRLAAEEGIVEVEMKLGWPGAHQHFIASWTEGVGVVAEAVEQVEILDRRDLHRADDVREVILEAGAEGEVRVFVELVALADEDAARTAAVGHEAPAQPIGGALPGIDAVEAGESVRIEQVGVVELDVDAVFVGDVAEVALVGGGGHGDDGL